jgi:hypothetical protein
MAKPNSKGMAANGRKVSTASFAGIPRAVMETEDFKSLRPSSVRLLLELAYQFKGNNNGDLTAAWGVLKARGWRSKATIASSVKELLAKKLIIRTRLGRFINPGGVCNLYALSWQPIHECGGKLDESPTLFPTRRF